jgi:hypothetical protein
MIEDEAKLKKEFESIPPSVKPTKFWFQLLKEGENLVGYLWDVFSNYYKKGFVPVRKREENNFLYFKNNYTI